MSKIIDELSVFFPAYNEEENIADTVKKALKVLDEIASKWEVIIINDGSLDNTLKESKKIAETDKRIRIISHEKNRGYGAAFKSGLYNAKYKWIAFTDSDGQFDFRQITKFIQTQKKSNADLVIGFYEDRRVAKSVIVTSKIWEIIVFILFGLKVKDIDCGFKLINKKVVDSIPKLESERGAFISSELLIKAKNSGFKIKEVSVKHYERKGGSPTGRNFDVILQSFKDLCSLYRQLR